MLINVPKLQGTQIEPQIIHRTTSRCERQNYNVDWRLIIVNSLCILPQMNEINKKSIYAKAWHGGKPYDSVEEIRLAVACEFLANLTTAGTSSAGRAERRKILDVGCGVGPLRKWLPAEEFELTGIDLSPEAIEKTRLQYDHGYVLDAEQAWPVEDASFNGLHMGAFMEHVTDWHAPLNRANLALAEGGLLAISIPNLGYWKEIRRLLRGRQPHWLRDMQHVHGYTADFFRKLLTIHGFDVVSVMADRVNFPLLPDSRFVRKKFARWGSVLIWAARLNRRVRVEDQAASYLFEQSKDVGLRSIEVI